MADRFHCSSPKGGLYSFALGAFIALNFLIAKAMLMKDFNAFELIFLRSVTHLVVLVTFSSWESTISYTLYDLFIYLCCGTMGLVSWSVMVLAFETLEVGDGTTIEIGVYVMFTMLFGHFLLSENVDKYDIAILIGDVVGVALVGKPSMIFGHNDSQRQLHIVGLAYVIVSGFLCATITIFVRIASNRGTLDMKLFQIFHGIAGIPLTILAALFSSPWKVTYDLNDYLLMLAYQFACLGQTACQALALENDDAKNVAVSSTISCVLTYIGQLVIFKATVDWVSILGSVCIITILIILQLKN